MADLFWNARGQIACAEHAPEAHAARPGGIVRWLALDEYQASLMRFFFARRGEGEQVECEWCVVRCADCRAVLSAEDRERGYDFCLACSRLESMAQNPNE